MLSQTQADKHHMVGTSRSVRGASPLGGCPRMCVESTVCVPVASKTKPDPRNVPREQTNPL